ncbi:MAG: hypothetical protein E4H21_09050 [Thermodesulfobacteriales bacterium]|nr:MAG: hypothetical protein E4H21_09050 [Thermodesulfobacteriales bacterium]
MEKKTETKPKIFIGSSAESLNISYAIQKNLEYDADVTVWPQSIFKPSRTSLDSLLKALDDNDFGIFVFTGDDLTTIRDVKEKTTRDNVIFELGLFIGRLGQGRSFIFKQRGEELHLPTDLLGLTPLDFPTDRSDGNLEAALGPACHTIRGILKDLGSNDQSEEDSDTPSEEEKATESDSIVMLNSWLRQNKSLISDVALNFNKLDDDLNLFPGTTKIHIKVMALKMNLKIVEEGDNTIMLKGTPRRVKMEE